MSPQGQQPSAISINMAPDAPEDAAAAAQNLADMQDLWNEWHSFKQRKLKGDLVRCELMCRNRLFPNVGSGACETKHMHGM